MSEAALYACSGSIAWVKDAGGILLVDAETGRSWALRDAEAVIWEWLCVGRSLGEIVRMISLIRLLSQEQAAELVADALLEWREGGILTGEPDSQGRCAEP